MLSTGLCMKYCLFLWASEADFQVQLPAPDPLVTSPLPTHQCCRGAGNARFAGPRLCGHQPLLGRNTPAPLLHFIFSIENTASALQDFAFQLSPQAGHYKRAIGPCVPPAFFKYPPAEISLGISDSVLRLHG